MKKVISLFMTMVMLLSITAGIDLSAYAQTYSGKCGDNVTWTLDTDTGVLSISGSGNMTDYSFNGVPWHEHRSKVKTVDIKFGVTSISDEAFSICENLTEITIPNSVTSIGYAAFFDCPNLTSITISDGVTSIGNLAFCACVNLTSINVDSKNKNYSSQDGILFNKDKTKIIQYPAGNKRKSYTIPNSVNCMGYAAFYGCMNLINITIPNSVTSIGYAAFCCCFNLTSITIPNSVTSVEFCAFEHCTNLTSINVDSNNQNYSSQDGVLFNKDKTEFIQYPIGNTRTSYTIPNGVTSIDDFAFEGCTNLTNVTISNRVTSINAGAFERCTSLICVTIGNSVTSIGEYAFSECTSLTSVVIPNSIATIRWNAFCYCEKLTDVYYSGTKEQWSKIEIGEDNECLTNATIHYNYNTNNNYTIKLYSTMPALTIGAGQEINCAAQLENNGVPVNGNDNALFEISVSNSEVLTVTNIRKDKDAEQKGENGTLFTLNGKNEGITKLQIREINTGLVYETTVNISNGILSFAANHMPSYYDHKFEYNGYVSGMYIDEFQYNEKQSTLSFDVYNSTSLMGVVEVYDSDGNLIDCEMIDRFDGNYVSSIKDSVVNMYKLVADGFKGELLTYKQDSYTKKTSINNLYVPKGGRIEITNNCMYSKSCAIANATELTVESILTFSNSISDATKTKEIAKDTVKKIIKDSIKKDLSELGNKITEKIAKKTTEEVSKNLLNGALSEFVSGTISVYTAQNIDLDKIIIDSCKSAGIGVAESALKKATGPAGLVLDGLFLFSDYADLSSFYISIGKDNSSNSLYIYMPKGDNSLCDNGVVIKPEDNSSDFTEENYVVRSLVIEKDSTLPKKSWDELNKISNDYIVREIHIEKDGKETQPKGRMQISVLIPDDYKNAKYVFVYWIKEDGTLEKLSVPATRQGDFLVFYVDHFSYYAIVSHNEHSFSNNSSTCSVCGIANPNYVVPQPTQPTPTTPTQPSAPAQSTTPTHPTPTAPTTTEKAPSGATKVNGEWVAKKQKNTKIKKVTGAKKSFKISWSKISGVTGYQIQYSTSSKFTKKTTKSVIVKKNKTTSATVKKLKAKKKYYVRVRTYKNVKLNGKTVKVYSSWSKAKTVTTKK